MKEVWTTYIKNNNGQVIYWFLASSKIKCNKYIEEWAEKNLDFLYEINLVFTNKSFFMNKLMYEGNIVEIEYEKTAYIIEIYKTTIL